MRVPGARLMTYDEMVALEGDSIRYVAPWGLKKVQFEKEQATRLLQLEEQKKAELAENQ